MKTIRDMAECRGGKGGRKKKHVGFRVGIKIKGEMTCSVKKSKSLATGQKKLGAIEKKRPDLTVGGAGGWGFLPQRGIGATESRQGGEK